jgi:hypothetical protein
MEGKGGDQESPEEEKKGSKADVRARAAALFSYEPGP